MISQLPLIPKAVTNAKWSLRNLLVEELEKTILPVNSLTVIYLLPSTLNYKHNSMPFYYIHYIWNIDWIKILLLFLLCFKLAIYAIGVHCFAYLKVQKDVMSLHELKCSSSDLPLMTPDSPGSPGSKWMWFLPIVDKPWNISYFYKPVFVIW